MPVPSKVTDLPPPAIDTLTSHWAPMTDVRRPDAATIVQVLHDAPTEKVIAVAALVDVVEQPAGLVTVTQGTTSDGMVGDGLEHAVPVSEQPVPPTVGPLEHVLDVATNSIR